MDNKMGINTNLSITESKKQRQNHAYREHSDGSQRGGGCGGMGEEVMGLRSTNRELQNSHGDVKYNVGNGAAKELTCRTHDMNHGGGMA